MKPKETKGKITVRKKVTLWALLMIIKIIEPTEYSHEYSKEIEAIKELIKEL